MLRSCILGLVVFLSACTTVQTTGTARHANDTLQVGSAIEPNSLNPMISTESVENMIGSLIFDKLVDVDGGGKVIPRLASVVPSLQNGGISRDGLTITYHLRHGVRWQDGAPFTSRDVAFSFGQVMNSRNNVSARVGYEDVASVQTPDPYTVMFHLKRPYAPIITTLFACNVSPQYVLPEHLLRNKADFNNVPFNSAPVGTGPYRLVKWARGDRIELAANPSYFLGRPHIQRIIVHIIPQENTAINQLRTHELDWFYNGSEASYNQLKRISAVKAFSTLENSYRGMMMNTESPIMRDVRVRRAIAYAIDKNGIVTKVTYGAAHAATEDIPSFLWAYDPHVQTYSQNVRTARALLAQAGWKPGPDGVVVKDGQPMDLRFVLRQGAVADTAMSVIIQSQLREVGIATTIKTFPGSTLFLNGTNGILAGGHYDIELSGFASGFDPDNAAEFTCAARPPNGYNWTRYCNSEMDAAQAQALQTYDLQARKRAYSRIEGLLARDVPQIFMYWAPEIDAVNPALKNFQPSPYQPDWNAYQWSW